MSNSWTTVSKNLLNPGKTLSNENEHTMEITLIVSKEEDQDLQSPRISPSLKNENEINEENDDHNKEFKLKWVQVNLCLNDLLSCKCSINSYIH